MLHSWLPHAALLLTIASAAISFYTFTSSLAAARQYGFGLTFASAKISSGSSGSNTVLAFVPIFGGRNLALALAVLPFYWRRRPRAIGTVLLCCVSPAVADTGWRAWFGSIPSVTRFRGCWDGPWSCRDLQRWHKGVWVLAEVRSEFITYRSLRSKQLCHLSSISLFSASLSIFSRTFPNNYSIPRKRHGD